MVREGIAVAALGHPVDRVTAAQAADELLTVQGVDGSFVLFPDADGRIILSGRSLGEPNVQVILEDDSYHMHHLLSEFGRKEEGAPC